MLKLAEHILQNKATDFDPSQFVDHYEQAVLEMLKQKEAGVAVLHEHAAPRPQNVMNVMDALTPSAKKKPARRQLARRVPRASVDYQSD